MVADAFAVAAASQCHSAAEFAVFSSKIVGDMDTALANFRNAVEESPDDADIRYNFGNFWDHAMQNPTEAAQQYESALAADLEHGPTLNNYSALLIEQARSDPPGSEQRSGRTTKAHDLLTRAEALAPGFPAYNLACLA